MYSLLCVIFIALSTVNYTSAAHNVQKFADRPIVYPGPTKETTQDKYGEVFEYQPDDIPDECKDQTYCTVRPKSYPEEKFNRLFNGMAFVPQPEPDILDGTDNRQGDPDEKDGCESVVTYEPLYKVKNLKGDWRTVIQAPEHNFVQRVRLETCKNTGAKCFTLLPSTPRFITSCKQKYSTWEIMVEGANGSETIKTDLPICCSCVYRTSNLGSRSGVPDD